MGLLVLVTIKFKVKQSRAKEELHGREGGETKSKGLTVLLECHLVITVRSISVKSKHVLLIQIIKTKIGVPMIFSKNKNLKKIQENRQKAGRNTHLVLR